jgi:hypothetical protein
MTPVHPQFHNEGFQFLKGQMDLVRGQKGVQNNFFHGVFGGAGDLFPFRNRGRAGGIEHLLTEHLNHGFVGEKGIAPRPP